MDLLSSLALYNEALEDVDFSNNALQSVKPYWASLSRNWFSKLTRLNLSSNELHLRDLADYLEINERGSRAFDRLLFTLRVLNLSDNTPMMT